jgi:hypothetical protein
MKPRGDDYPGIVKNKIDKIIECGVTFGTSIIRKKAVSFAIEWK